MTGQWPAGSGIGHRPWHCLLLPRPVAASDLVVMRRIDELHLNLPFAGSRMLRDLLVGEDFPVGGLHVASGALPGRLCGSSAF